MLRSMPATVVSHWHELVDEFHVSSLSFYESVESAIKGREIPGVSTSRIDWKEGGALTARREYLRVTRGNLRFDICAAPFGRSFFFSWWLTERPPSLGMLYAFLLVVGVLVYISVLFDQLGLFLGLIVGGLSVPLIPARLPATTAKLT